MRMDLRLFDLFFSNNIQWHFPYRDTPSWFCHFYEKINPPTENLITPVERHHHHKHTCIP
jgi:hypothetical protein